MSEEAVPLEKRLAAALLQFAPTSEVTDALLPAVTIGKRAPTLGTAPSRNVAQTQVARGAAYAVAIANAPGADPDLLADLGRRSQKSIRRAVAGNPNTPMETLESLAEWASQAGKEDLETLIALCETIPPPQWIPTLDALLASMFPKWSQAAPLNKAAASKMASQLVRRQDPDLVWETLQLGSRHILEPLAVEAVEGRLPVSLADLLDAATPQDRVALLTAVIDHASGPILELDNRTVDHLVAARASLRRIRGTNCRWSDYGVNALLNSGDPELAEVLLYAARCDRAQLTDGHLELVVRDHAKALAGNLLSHVVFRDRLTAEQIIQLVPHLSTEWTNVRALLNGRGPELPPATRVQVLRCGNRSSTQVWLTGQLGVAPTAAEVEALAAEPGNSLHDGRWSTAPAQPSHAADFVSRFADAFSADVYTNPGVPDVLNIAGHTTVAYAAQPFDGQPNAFLLYLADRMKARFGGDPNAWALLPRIAANVPIGTVEEILDLVAQMLHTPGRDHAVA